VRAARAEFFDTRVSGRAEMWAAVKLVCELVERGERGDAQAVLDAAGGTCPSGTLWGRRGGCYDERGERYVVPIWCVGWPDGVPLEDDDEESGEAEAEMEERGGGQWKKEGKGKERAVDEAAIKGREIRVRARLSHTARDVMVRSGEEDSVSMLMQRLRSSGEVSLSRAGGLDVG
jgi:Ubiquitin-binding domain